MALTLTKVAETPWVNGNKKEVLYDATFDSSYADNGEALVATDVGLRKILHVSDGVARKSDGSDAVLTSYDYTNEKLLAFRQKDPAAAGGADIALPEVGNTADLSAYSVRLRILGR